MKKTRLQKSHATVPFRSVHFAEMGKIPTYLFWAGCLAGVGGAVVSVDQELAKAGIAPHMILRHTPLTISYYRPMTNGATRGPSIKGGTRP